MPEPLIEDLQRKNEQLIRDLRSLRRQLESAEEKDKHIASLNRQLNRRKRWTGVDVLRNGMLLLTFLLLSVVLLRALIECGQALGHSFGALCAQLRIPELIAWIKAHYAHPPAGK